LLNLDQIEKETGYLGEREWIDPTSASNSTYAFTTDHVLYSKLRPNLNKVVCPDRPGLCTTELIRLRPDPKRLYRRFLTYFLRSEYYMGFARQVVAGAKMPRMVMDRFWEFKLPLPPLPEQHRIVEILDQADALRQQRRQADALSQRILPALFQEMFGDLRRNPRDWATSELGDLAEIVSGITKGRRTNETDLRPVSYLSVANVQDGHLRLDNVKEIAASESEVARYLLRVDDLVLTEGGDPDKLGRGALWSGEIGKCIHQNHIFRVRTVSPQILPVFLSALTASEYGKAYFFSVAKKTTGIASINKRQLSAFPVVIPPLDIQKRFTEALNALSECGKSQATTTATLETLFQTLLHRAFDGSLTAKWREGHAKELLQEMTHQAHH
jgi:type I restriction enzyme S subunit